MDKKDVFIVLFVIILLAIFIIFIQTQNKKPNDLEPLPDGIDLGEFCGFSTLGTCSSDFDCIFGGCSSQVCQSKYEEPLITTCEFQECYNADVYQVSCGCVNNRCQWHK